MIKPWTSNDQKRHELFLGSPRIHFTWRGVCDGLPEFIPTYSVKVGTRVLFTAQTAESAERFLAALISRPVRPRLKLRGYRS